MEKPEQPAPEVPFLKPAGKKPLSEAEEAQKFKLKPIPPKEVEVPAKDQIQLKGVKPKRAETPPPEEHMELEKPGAREIPKLKPAPPKQEQVPPSSQVALKPSFRPKEVVSEQVQLEQVQLKAAPFVPKV